MESSNRLLLLAAVLGSSLLLGGCALFRGDKQVEQQQTEEQAAAEEAAEDADSTPPRVIEPNVARRKIKTPRIDNENWEIGAGFGSVTQRGTTHGDSITPSGFATNNAGGVLGGISTGQDLEVGIAIKPTSSIISPRQSIDIHNQPVEVVTKGRHDPCVGIRATPIAEAMLALVVMEHALRHRAQCGDVATGTGDEAAQASPKASFL